MMIDESLTFNETKSLLQCPSKNCDYMKSIENAKSENSFGFSYDCNNIELLFYNTSSPTITIPTKYPTTEPTIEPTIYTLVPTKSLSKANSNLIEYIIIGFIVLSTIIILIICLKYSQSKVTREPLMDNIQ